MTDNGSPAVTGSWKEACAQGWRWVACGRQRLAEQPRLWLGMAVIYLIGAALVEAVPFVGHLVVVLFTPMLLAGALLGLKEPPPEPQMPPRRLDEIRVPLRQLFAAFATESRTYAAVLMGIVVLGLVAVGAIAQYFTGSGSFSGGWSAARHGTSHPAVVFARMLVGASIDAVLFMALVYAVHRSVFAWREPMAAIADSFRACVDRPLAVAVFAAAFLVPYLAIASAFRLASWLGYGLLFTLGAVLVPLFVLASYCSYRDIFPSRE